MRFFMILLSGNISDITSDLSFLHFANYENNYLLKFKRY